MLKEVTLNRILFASFTLFMAVLGAGIVVLMINFFEPEPNSVLGAYNSPFQVLTNPATAGMPAVVRGERCVTVDHDVDVKVSVTLRQVEGTFIHRDLVGAPQTRLKGCNTTTQVVGIPATAPAGRYIIDGLSIAVDTGEGRIWWSEEFDVVRQSVLGGVQVPREAEAR